MDFLSAYSAINQGHSHPKIMQAMIEQLQKLSLTSRAFRNDQLGLFYQEICDLTSTHKVLPMNSGAEAVETVIKAVCKWDYKIKGVPQDQEDFIQYLRFCRIARFWASLCQVSTEAPLGVTRWPVPLPVWPLEF